jgi:hypothetical protein
MLEINGLLGAIAPDFCLEGVSTQTHNVMGMMDFHPPS